MATVTRERMLQMETGGFGESLEERIFFTGPTSTVEPDRRARLQGRKAAARLMRAMATHGRETEAHCERVAVWSRRLARDLGLPSERVLDVELGALLHDVGYIAVVSADFETPDVAECRELMKHCELGAAILTEIPELRRAVPLVLSHHEEFDGGGYPRGLTGRDIPIDGRIFRLVDAYETMTVDTSYGVPLTDEAAREEIQRRAGRSFDPLVVAAFMRISPAEWRTLAASVA